MQRPAVSAKPKRGKRRYAERLNAKAMRFLVRQKRQPRKKGRAYFARMEKNITPLAINKQLRLFAHRSRWRFRSPWGMGMILACIEAKMAEARPGRLRRYWYRRQRDAITHIRRRLAAALPRIAAWDTDTRKGKESFLEALEHLRKKVGDGNPLS